MADTSTLAAEWMINPTKDFMKQRIRSSAKGGEVLETNDDAVAE